MFEKAARLKLRFDSSKGQLTVEDLFDLPLTSNRGASLDEVAINLNRQLKASANESFVAPTSKPNELLQLKFDLVKYVIAARITANEAARKAGERKEQKEKILAIMAKKQDAALEGASLDDLQKMLAEL